mmetsp:Transcript_120526/g.234754  ORF Transcript_120526/g.234754 Transcript_120526/m.234754 type:complete len:206 (-) Transcript_120526:189-806(-)
MSMALMSISFCSLLCSWKSFWPRFTFTDGSLAMMPDPVQGASKRTRSSFGNTPLSFRPSMFVTITFVRPIRWQLETSDLHRSALRSLAKRVPVFRISCPIYVVLPPGAAAISNTVSFCCGARAITGMKDEALCTMYWPPKYSGVAPIGTSDSKILRPTLVQSPTTSSCTFRAESACIRLVRRAFSEFVRIVNGRCCSFASKNLSA